VARHAQSQQSRGSNLPPRRAVLTAHRSLTPLGEYLRRLKAKLGPAGAITATARKVATLFCTVVTR
jgi:hypothetical protein